MEGFRGGELFVIFVALAFLAILPIVIGAVIFFGIKRAKKNRSEWQRLAAKLNMSPVQPSGLGLSGNYRSRPVDIAVSVRGGSESREVFTYCKVDFAKELRLILGIESRGFVSSVIGSDGGIKLGNPGFDDNFSAYCYDENVLRSFLLADLPSVETANLLSDLVLAARSNLRIQISDRSVYLESSGDSPEEARIAGMMDLAVRLADRFDAARRNFPPAAWEVQAFENWARVARGFGIGFDRDDFRINGVVNGFRVTANVTSVKSSWRTAFRLDFPASLTTGLQILPENQIHRAMAWVGAQDIRVGIDDFDRAFVVKAKNEAEAKKRLRPELCERLLALKSRSSELTIDDTSMTISVNEVVGDAAKLQSYIRDAVEASAMLGR